MTSIRRTLIIGVLLVLGASPVLCADDVAAPYQPYIPEDKGLAPEWIASLSERGEPRAYQGDELDLIGMPCGGIGAGQLEISGQGKLGTWWIFNIAPPPNGGLGGANGARYLKPAPIEVSVQNGFAIRVEAKDGTPTVLRLDAADFDDMRFVGEYPIAHLEYRRKDHALPVSIRSEVFSPFVPLSVRDSANPVTVLRFTVTNTSEEPIDVTLGGWLENASEVSGEDQRCNRTFRREGLTGVQLGLLSESAPPPSEARVRIPRLLPYDDFEGEAFSDQWEVEGAAFGDGPLVVAGARFYAPLRKHHGEAIASSFHSEQDEDLEGSLTSRPFVVERNHIRFRIAGGDHQGETCINLIVDDEIVRTATGDNSNTLRVETWDVEDLQGKTARLEIIDRRKGSWGFVKVDDIAFLDQMVPYGNGRPAYGNLALSVLDENAAASAGWTSPEQFIKALEDGTDDWRDERTYGGDQAGGGAVTSACTVAPNESKTVTFLVSWYFPNLYNNERGCPGLVGHIYNNWYGSSADAAHWVAENFDRLHEQTELFSRTYHDTTIPYWLANRITMPVSTLACENVKIWENGRMYAYEGVSFCLGTCGHVHNFAAAAARLFPELERSVRLQQDLALAFDPASGRVNFRGANGADPEHAWAYASDAQSGYVLKLYREHLMSPDNSFLDEVWPKVKRIIGYMIFHDGATRGVEPNGVLEDLQTFWDPMWYGPNPYNNTLYLAALRAAEEMARLKGETALADRYRAIHENGRDWMNERMWNGE